MFLFLFLFYSFPWYSVIFWVSVIFHDFPYRVFWVSVISVIFRDFPYSAIFGFSVILWYSVTFHDFPWWLSSCTMLLKSFDAFLRRGKLYGEGNNFWIPLLEELCYILVTYNGLLQPGDESCPLGGGNIELEVFVSKQKHKHVAVFFERQTTHF